MSTHGTTSYIDGAQNAATQLVKDLNLFQSNNTEAMLSLTTGTRPSSSVGAIFGAIGSIAGATAGSGSLGVNLANLVNGSANTATTGALEISISNFSSQPVVLFDYIPSSANVTKTPQPLLQGDDDIFLLTRSSAFDSSASIKLQFLVGSIEVDLTFSYSASGDPGRWQINVSIDGDNTHQFPSKLQLFGATFQGNTGFSSFSLYTSPIETSNGQIDLNFYDLATS